MITKPKISNSISAFTIRGLYFINPIIYNYIRGVIKKLIYLAQGYGEFYTGVSIHRTSSRNMTQSQKLDTIKPYGMMMSNSFITYFIKSTNKLFHFWLYLAAIVVNF